MARRLVVIFALVLLATPFARAQQLQRLHVRSFTLTTDTAQPKVDVPFSVTLTIRVAENVDLQNVFLPSFSGPEDLGDVRQESRGVAGTLYRETMTLVSHAPGLLIISSGYLDAVDARDGKPKRFLSNDLHLNVGGAGLAASHPARLVVWLLLAAAVLLGLVLLARRRAARTPMFVQAPAPPQPAPPPGPSQWEAALADLRLARDRKAVMRARSALWHIAGAAEGQTLAAVLAQPQAADERLRRTLIALERAAFVEEEHLGEAIDDVLAQREESFT